MSKMTEDRRSPHGISMIQLMLNRLKASENLQPSSPNTYQENHKAAPKSDDPTLNLSNRDRSESLTSPDRIRNNRDSGYDTGRTELEEDEQDLGKEEREEPGLQEIARKSETDPYQESPHTTRDPKDPAASNENEVGPATAVESRKPPPLPPKQRKNQLILQRTFTLRDFTLNLEPINLLGEICSGEEWAKYLPPEESPKETDASGHPQTETSDCTSHDSNSGKLDEVSPIQQETSDSSVFAIPKALLKNETVPRSKSDVAERKRPSSDEELMVFYVFPKNGPTYIRNVTDLPLDLSVVTSTGVLDNSALKSRIQLSKKRNHRPPQNRKKVKSDVLPNIPIKLPKVDASRTRSSSTPVLPVGASVFYTYPASSFQAADLQSLSSGVLDNSALKSRIQLSKKRNHRPPQNRKKVKSDGPPNFSKVDASRTRSSSTPVLPVGTSVFYSCSGSSFDTEDPQSPADGDDKQKESAAKAKLWKWWR